MASRRGLIAIFAYLVMIDLFARQVLAGLDRPTLYLICGLSIVLMGLCMFIWGLIQEEENAANV